MTSSPLTVPVSLASGLTNIQLLELPPKVLAQLESGQDPELQIKSFSKYGSFAAICTGNQTYKLIVHQTSNSVHVLEPVAGQLRAMARAGAVLEMIPVADLEVEAMIEMKLREELMDWNSDQSPRKTSTAEDKRSTKGEIFADMPYSTDELEKSWFQLCCFQDEYGCHIPNSQSLLNSWKSLLTASTAASTPITIDNQAELWPMLREEQMPMALFNVLVLHATESSSDDGAALITWTGRLLLAVRNAMDRMQFKEEWVELLPGTIATETNVGFSLLKEYADLCDPTLVKLKSPVSAKVPVVNASSKGGGREWHERLGKAKGK
jgi:hypothetical protein